MTQPDDASIIQQVREGDKDAFGILIERHYPMVYRLACRVIGHPDLAQDRAQEACLQAFLSLDSLRDPSAFQSWVYGITLNVCHAYLRQQKPTITLDDTLVRLLQDKRPRPKLSPNNVRAILTCAKQFVSYPHVIKKPLCCTTFKG
ncbi:MAG: sigma factor [Chloroflexota bacterium]